MKTMHGKILFKYGTMSAGKSMHLLATAHNFQQHSIPFLIFKSSIDDRDGDNVIHSRALGDRECISISPNHDFYKIVGDYLDKCFLIGEEYLKWILVDECQFLTEKQVEELAAIADNFGINIICYGLRTDFRTTLFPGSKRLFEIADSFEEIKSSCDCDSKTIFNARIDKNRQFITNGDQIEVGGDNRYTSVCRKCYFEKINHPLYRKNKNNLD
jgi:thymidine kinase